MPTDPRARAHPAPSPHEPLVADDAYVSARLATLRRPPATDVRAYLERRTPEELVALLLELSRTHAPVRRDLQARAAAAAGGAALLERHRARLARAFRLPAGDGVVEGLRAVQYLARASEAVQALHAVVERAPDVAVALAEEALALGDAAADRVDDVEGRLTLLFDDLHALHLRACEEARPEPAALARRLVAMAAASDHWLMVHAATEYADVLGPRGLAAYREAAGALWDAYPPLGPGEHAADRRRHRLAAMMEHVARAMGSVETLVDVYRRELTDARGFLRLADAYRQAGDLQSAALWADRGCAELPRTGDHALRDFLVDTYLAMGRHDDALRTAWVDFAERPDWEGFRRLRGHVTRVEGAWPAWRRRAVDAVRDEAARRRDEAGAARPDHTELVRILLAEGFVDQARDAAASGDCAEPLRQQLARRRERA